MRDRAYIVSVESADHFNSLREDVDCARVGAEEEAGGTGAY